MVGGYQIVDFTDFDIIDAASATITVENLYHRVAALMPLSGKPQHKPYIVKIKYDGNIYTTQNFSLVSVQGTTDYGIILQVLVIDPKQQSIVELYEMLGFTVTSEDVVTAILI